MVSADKLLAAGFYSFRFSDYAMLSLVYDNYETECKQGKGECYPKSLMFDGRMFPCLLGTAYLKVPADLGMPERRDSGMFPGWKQRFNIALAMAKGMLYLQECIEWIIHCDTKPENILLDEDMEPKITDFGLSKLLNRAESPMRDMPRVCSSPRAPPCPCHVGVRPPPPLRFTWRRARARTAPLRAADQEQLLTALREQPDPDAALRMLNAALARDDFAPGPEVYEEIIRKLGAAGAVDLMKVLVTEMRRVGHQVKLGVVHSFLDSYGRRQLFDDAVDLVLNHLDPLFGIQADTVVYNHLLNVLVEGSKMKLLESVYSEMVARGIKPDVVTFNTLMKALCRAHQVRTAVLVLEEMSSNGVAPDETTFTTLMQGFVEEGNIKAALRVKARMLEMGCSPTRVTVNVLINGYCKLGRVEDALGYVQQEIADGFEPDQITYNTFVNGLCQNGHVGHALKVMDVMVQEGHDQDVFTYNIVVNCLCKNGQLEEAKGILNQMVDRGCLPDITTFNTLIVALCSGNRLEEALDLARQTMTANGFEVDVITYGTLINGLCKAGRTQVALKLLRAEGLLNLGMDDYFIRAIEIIIEKTDLRESDVSAIRGYLKIRKFYDALATFGRLLEINNHQWSYR
ncbi:hypothetical protein E2562_015777 [Oryza meyeriana var. granulata]|uniref:Protein kinase domain-containing protein n=1 Tax=Oryza meyeriana var. granulata TaxID=110450 RepID=A0A6G1D346_9ORYZ|nr:hypothetical protein E2562_015777 [Oryza meyeriana var. granulata]